MKTTTPYLAPPRVLLFFIPFSFVGRGEKAPPPPAVRPLRRPYFCRLLLPPFRSRPFATEHDSPFDRFSDLSSLFMQFCCAYFPGISFRSARRSSKNSFPVRGKQGIGTTPPQNRCTAPFPRITLFCSDALPVSMLPPHSPVSRTHKGKEGGSDYLYSVSPRPS